MTVSWLCFRYHTFLPIWLGQMDLFHPLLIISLSINIGSVLQCALLGTSLAYGCNIRELWGTKDDGFCPPFNLGSRYNLARDRYLSWRRYLKLWPPDHSDNPWYMAHSLIHAFNQRRREVVEPGTECIVDESMGMWKPFFENTPEGIPSLCENLKASELSIRT